MDTNELIDNLAKDLRPVRPLPAPAARAGIMGLIALAAVAAAVFLLGGPRPDWAAVLQDPALMPGNVLMLAAGILAAVAAFTLSVPDTSIRKPVVLMLGLATTVWAGLCLDAAAFVTAADMRAEGAVIRQSSTCVGELIALALLPLGASFFMSLRALPVWRGWTGYALTLSMASFAAFGMRFFCPIDAAPHLLLWHFLPVVALSVSGALLGRAVLRFRL